MERERARERWDTRGHGARVSYVQGNFRKNVRVRGLPLDIFL